MRLIIGTDEAGYGPNLGPLVVTGSSWLLSEELIRGQNEPAAEKRSREIAPDLYQVLNSLFGRLGDSSSDKMLIGDSKEAFKSNAGLSNLELAVLPIWQSSRPSDLQEKWKLDWRGLVADLRLSCLETKLDLDSDGQDQELPWYREFNSELPIDAEIDRLHQFTEQLGAFSSQQEVEFRQKTQIVEPGRFNRLCDKLGNKATLLSHVTLSLIFESVSHYFAKALANPISEVYVLCDKHGGRNSYAGLIQSVFADSWVRVISEGRSLSRYVLTWNDRPIYFDFVAKGEQHLSIAVASMFSKYLREISMISFNQFWLSKNPSIRPTAGYPADAKRFRREIEPFAAKLDLVASDWWRIR